MLTGSRIDEKLKTFEVCGIQNQLFATKHNAAIMHGCGRSEERIFGVRCLRYTGFIFD
jgi:hypothetical protein